MPPPSTIIFDLGGVVIRIVRSWAQACERAGLDLRQPDSLDALDFMHQRHGPTDLYMAGRMSCDEYVRAMADAVENLYTPDEILRLHEAWTIDDEPGIADLIASLNAAGLTTACLSNTNPTHWRILTKDKPSPAIAALTRTLVSHELGCVKPDAEIYAEAERLLSARREQIVFFDDVAHNVEAAIARGWNAFLIDHARPTPPQISEDLRSLGVRVPVR
jgi:HAD superfamily hydrolase (TIGR01509 family)